MDENRDNQTPTPDENLEPERPAALQTPPESEMPPQAETTSPPPPSGGPTTPPPAPGMETDKDAKMWGMFCHLAGLLGFLPVVPFPVGNVLGPLILWLIKKDDIPFVNDQGKEALNFQISMSIYSLICLPLVCLAGLGAILAGIVAIVDLVFIIIASIESNKGTVYRYPLTIRMIK